MDMSALVESVPPEAVLLSCPLTADGQKAPFLMAWVRRHGQLPSAVMAQLAEAGFLHAVDLSHVHSASPTDGVDQRVWAAAGSLDIASRAVSYGYLLRPMQSSGMRHIPGAACPWLRVGNNVRLFDACVDSVHLHKGQNHGNEQTDRLFGRCAQRMGSIESHLASV